MRGARMTAASPWDTLCCVSLSSKLPISAKCAGEPRQGLGRGRQRSWGPSRISPWVQRGSRLEATGMGSPRGWDAEGLPWGLGSAPLLGWAGSVGTGHRMVAGTLLCARGCAQIRIRPCSTPSCTAPSSACQTGDPCPRVPHQGWGAGAARRAQSWGSPASLPAPTCSPAPGGRRHDLGSTGKVGAPAASVLPSRLQAGSTQQLRKAERSRVHGEGGQGIFIDFA